MIRAYILVETDVEPLQFVKAVRELRGVVAADGLFGPLDAIVVVEAEDMPGLERVVWSVHEVPGLKSGDTRIARSL